MEIVPSTDTVSLRREGSRVLILHGPHAINMPWEAALEVAGLLRNLAKQAEAEANVEAIIKDSAILLRVGAGFTLSRHPGVIAEAAKEAAWDSSLRRYLPGGVKSREALGTPAVQHVKEH